MIVVDNVPKRYGKKPAADALPSPCGVGYQEVFRSVRPEPT